VRGVENGLTEELLRPGHNVPHTHGADGFNLGRFKTRQIPKQRVVEPVLDGSIKLAVTVQTLLAL
jgi:hypothetical protein